MSISGGTSVMFPEATSKLRQVSKGTHNVGADEVTIGGSTQYPGAHDSISSKNRSRTIGKESPMNLTKQSQKLTQKNAMERLQ